MAFNAKCPLCHRPASFEPAPYEIMRQRRHYRCEHCKTECLLDRWDVERIDQLPSGLREMVLEEARNVPAGMTLLIEVGEPRNAQLRAVGSLANCLTSMLALAASVPEQLDAFNYYVAGVDKSAMWRDDGQSITLGAMR